MSSVAQICHRLDGIPLAIEMAAARVAGLTTAEIAAGLDDCLALLTNGSRVALPRHRTLRAALDWSYGLLNEPERDLLASLAVFSGGCYADAVKAICEARDAVPLLLQLVQKSLVIASPHGNLTRYRLLETVRQYAAEKLRERGGAELMRERHLAWYLALAEETMDLDSAAVQAWLRRIEPEHDNLRAAFAWARERASTDQAEMMLRVAAALRPFRYQRGFMNEGLAWLDEALQQGSGAPTQARARALLAKASILLQWNDSLNAVRCASEGLALCQQVGDDLGSAWCLFIMTIEGYDIADPHIVSYAEQSLRLFRKAGCQDGASRALLGLGIATQRETDYTRAQAMFEEAYAIAREIHDTENMADSLVWMANTNAPRALELCKQEIEARRQCDDAAGLAERFHTLGRLYYRAKDYDQAAVAIEKYVSFLEQGESQSYSALSNIAGANNNLGLAEYLRGNHIQAIPRLQRSVSINEELGDTFSAMRSKCIMIAALIASGQLTTAADLLRMALAFYPSRGHWMEVVWVFDLAAWLARQQQKPLRSARLLGVIDELVRRYDLASQLVYSLGYTDSARSIAETRTALGDAAFDAAFVEGQQMSLEQAVQYALAGLGFSAQTP